VHPDDAQKKDRIVVIPLNPLTLTAWTLHPCILATQGHDEAKMNFEACPGCYTHCVMRADIEQYFLNPPPGSAAARAAEFGIDLTLTLENLRLTQEARIRKMDDFIESIAKLKSSMRIIGPANAIADQNH
jgi:hypothetical protein